MIDAANHDQAPAALSAVGLWVYAALGRVGVPDDVRRILVAFVGRLPLPQVRALFEETREVVRTLALVPAEAERTVCQLLMRSARSVRVELSEDEAHRCAQILFRLIVAQGAAGNPTTTSTNARSPDG